MPLVPHKRLCLGKKVEQQGGEAGESALTMATMFLTAFRVQVSKGAKREEAFNCAGVAGGSFHISRDNVISAARDRSG